ncbi:MAG: sulfatase-like hydrolase/transferase [Firmicutes bacterium]|nr:sulfatase-like hydrolase/transferase [Bacillota bacterium]
MKEGVDNGIQATTKWSRFRSALLIPCLYVLISLVLDVILIVSLGWNIPSGYLFSFALILIFAAVISCIPNRVAQTVIFCFILGVKALFVIFNIVAHSNLGEIFILENFRALREIFAGAESSHGAPWLQIVLVSLSVIVFLAIAIYVCVSFRRKRAGYKLRGIVASALVVFMSFGALTLNYVGLAPLAHTFTDNLLNSRFVFNEFNNRHFFLKTFGPTMFYTMNTLDLVNMRPRITDAADSIEYDFEWNTPNEDYVEFLDEDYNLIMLMLETVEFDAVNPFLTPNLWRIKTMSTWVDGYFGHERTCMTEYVSLTGSHVQGREMWSSFARVEVPQSMPNIFRRMGHEQIGAFHNFNKEFYNRVDFFTPNRLGFDFIRDLECYGVPIHSSFNQNSDRLIFETMLDDIAPDDRTFFSYVLNVAPHSPHFDSSWLIPKREFHPNGPLVREYDANGISRQVFEVRTWNGRVIQNFAEVLEKVYEMEYYLRYFFPKLETGTDLERRAIFAYIVSLKDFDIGIGKLLHRLETTLDKRHECGTVYLIDTTALVLYSDHFNYGAYGEIHRSILRGGPRSRGGGLLSNNFVNQTLGEKLVFMVYNPRDMVTRAQAMNAPTRYELLDYFLASPDLDEHINRWIPPVGNRIERFMTNSDIFKTVAHLFNIETNSEFTLGVSVLNPNTHSVGIGFMTGMFFGLDIETGLPFVTRDLINFHGGSLPGSVSGTRPGDKTIEIFTQRINSSMATMFALRRHYETNTLRLRPEAFYVMG